MVNKNAVVDLITFNPEVTPIVADNNVVANVLPLHRGVESLVKDSVKPKGGSPNNSAKL